LVIARNVATRLLIRRIDGIGQFLRHKARRISGAMNVSYLRRV
jgi:hypothetical protein